MWKTSIGLIGTLALSVVMAGCGTSQGQVQPANSHAESSRQSALFDFNQHVGWIHGGCLAIKRTDLHPGMIVHVITLEPPQRVLKIAVTGVATPDSGCAALLPDRIKVNQKNGRSFYMLDLQKDATLMAVGVVGYEGELIVSSDAVRIDLDHDGRQESARACQTSEGIRFSLVSADQSDKAPFWMDYYYLGYDTKPTCKD